jgi:chemotaxis protein CheX
MSDLNEEEIKVFIDAIDHYFMQLSNERATIERAYLGGDLVQLPLFDFTGLIEISGGFRGTIYVSAPRAMMRQLLTAMHEPNQTDEQLADTVGELANTLAGNARQYFGESMEISVPSTFMSPSGSRELRRKRPYVIIVHWRGLESSLIIDLERVSRTATAN